MVAALFAGGVDHPETDRSGDHADEQPDTVLAATARRARQQGLELGLQAGDRGLELRGFVVARSLWART